MVGETWGGIRRMQCWGGRMKGLQRGAVNHATSSPFCRIDVSVGGVGPGPWLLPPGQTYQGCEEAGGLGGDRHKTWGRRLLYRLPTPQQCYNQHHYQGGLGGGLAGWLALPLGPAIPLSSVYTSNPAKQTLLFPENSRHVVLLCT